MGKATILIVDTTTGQVVGRQVRAILDQTCEYRTELVSSILSAEADVARSTNLVVAVLPESRSESERMLASLSAAHAVPVLPVLTPLALADDYDERLVPAYDVLVTPLRDGEVRFRVARFVAARTATMVSDDVAHATAIGQLIGEDAAFLALKRRLRLAARSDSTVLLTGETGTGKERCARALHYLSARTSGPFVPVNCGAIPLELFESELYGHLKGAFTGAATAHAGLIAEAEGGTLFLDEVETLTQASQVKLLRFLQDHTYHAVGSARLKQADVWIVAATNVDLSLKIRDGSFREDLFYRLAVINLRVPPLRERRLDIRRLAAHFWSLYARRAGRSDDVLSDDVLNELAQYAWPGNVRELENVIQQLAVLTESRVRPEDLPIPRARAVAMAAGVSGNTTDTSSFARRKRRAVEEFERSYLTKLLVDHNGNVTHAARTAKKDRRALGKLIKKYRIEPE